MLHIGERHDVMKTVSINDVFSTLSRDEIIDRRGPETTRVSKFELLE